MPRTMLAVLLGFVAIVTAAVASYLEPKAVPVAPIVRPKVDTDATLVTGPPKVKLAVLVVFDQMRGDYLPRWREHFSDGGFRRLMDDGCWFPQCYYPYASTTTGPGHAAMMTGTTQDRTGIIGNDWYERRLGKTVYCAGSDRFETVGSAASKSSTVKTHIGTTKKKSPGGSPERLMAPSLGDNVKAAGRGGKVIGVSLKDRAAIFPSGHHADGAYWFNGEFVTSNYYTDVLPGWVREFNHAKLADSWYGQSWNRLRPDLDYDKLIGPDAGLGEANRAGLGIKFPHPITGGKSTLTGSYYEALDITPFGNDLLLAFAKAAIDAEKLGQRDDADLLTISFSANDYCGHAYGPDSQEVFDMTLRSDLIMKDLLNYLDEKVGEGNYTLVLTADHGICPLPEVSQVKGLDAQRIPLTNIKGKSARGLKERAEAMLEKKYGKPLAGSVGPSRWLESVNPPWIYLNLRQIEARNLNREEVTNTLAAWLKTQNGMERVYTAAEIAKPAAEEIGQLVKASTYPGRSGDIFIMQKRYYLYTTSNYQTGTTHGTAYDYDRHVPLVVFGPHLPKGEQSEPVTPQHAAVILADALGLQPPRDALYSLPKSLRSP